MSLYARRGVSAQKEEVHAATAGLDAGLYPQAFCKLYPDALGGDDAWVNVMHADGAGTKAILAYLWWRETGDLNVWKGIAQDAVVMNTDDLLCTGIYTNLLYSSSIDRNKATIPGEVIKTLIEGTQEFLETLRSYGCAVTFCGGETADVGDVVRTVAVNGTMAARWPQSKIISNSRIPDAEVIVGFASYGQATYEHEYNSGIGSNGLTSARHDVLSAHYKSFPETFEPGLDEEVVYVGTHRLQDPVAGAPLPAGKLLLSPTRTYLPLMQVLLQEYAGDILGLIHCSGGGQTKCMKYLARPVRIVKDNLFTPPPIFRLVQEGSGADAKEMYQVYNMGCRLELYTTAAKADVFIKAAKSFGIDAQVIGRVEGAAKKSLRIETAGAVLEY